jgi:hypothetical protein
MTDVKTPKNETPRTIILQAQPGDGKSMMIGMTAVNKPIHFIDIDRKIKSAGWAQESLKNGQISVWELAEPIDDSNLISRVRQLGAEFAGTGTGKGPMVAPKGWTRFAEYIYTLPKDETAMRAGGWAIDSLTLLNEHFKSHLMFLSKRNKFAFDQWNALKIGWLDTISVLRDLARENGKDLYFTVHERNKSEPGDNTLGVKQEMVKFGEETAMKDVYVGMQDIVVLPSLDGQIAGMLGAHTDEFYHLYVKVSGEKVEWKCRIHPDGKRSLRTSFVRTQSVWEPDFRKIWGNKT